MDKDNDDGAQPADSMMEFFREDERKRAAAVDRIQECMDMASRMQMALAIARAADASGELDVARRLVSLEMATIHWEALRTLLEKAKQ